MFDPARPDKGRSLIILLIFGIGILGALLGTIAAIANIQRNSEAVIGQISRELPSNVSIIPFISPTPFPFQELTIPYLRSRSFKSRLGELSKSYQNEYYTAYLTNYDSDGLRINGLLTQPNDNKPSLGWPAIIFVHGYIPPKSYRTTQNYYDYVDYLARNGFVVFKIDLRGHDASEGDPSGAYFSADYIIDTLNAYAALQSSDFVNPKEIGLWGHSMAGNVVMRSFAVKPDIPAVVIWAGAVYTYVDQAEYGINDESYQPPPSDTARVRRRQQLRELYGNPTQDSPFWQQVAVTRYLKDIQGAIQINHAVYDPVVSIEYSRNIMKLLDETSVKHELNEYPIGGHNLTGTSFTQAMQNTVAFFRTNLGEN